LPVSAVTPTFQPGQTVLHRGFVEDRLVFLRLARVVGHDERGLRLWIPHGTPMVVSLAEDGRGIRDMAFEEWIEQRQELRTSIWRGPNIFMLIPDRTAHSVWWFWDPRDGSFAGWYINLEEPSVCWTDGELSGVDTTDQDLDVWVYPDRSWEWKDEDEVDERSAFPEHYWVRDTAAVRAEGERVVKLVEAGTFPFDGTWQDYRPPAAWSSPVELPDGWDRPRRATPID
jgi:hypothetical protein